VFLKKLINPYRAEGNNSPTVFHVTHYKAGSQWVYAVLNEVAGERIVKPLPAADHVTKKAIVSSGIYPCVYLRRDQLVKAAPPSDIRIFIVIRDLRDTLISQYFSVRYSHKILDPLMQELRDTLSSMSITEGLVFMMKRRLKTSADIQKSWINSGHLLIRYEDLNKDAFAGFQKIFTHCTIPFDDHHLRWITERHSFERQAGRKRGEEDIHSHHRKGIIGDWRNYFDEKIKLFFKEKYGNILIDTGYENSLDW
jgi:hypothetical protein